MSMNMAIGMGMLGRRGPIGSVSFINPASLFAGGEQGGWYDPNNLATMWQDTAGTVPVTAVGQSVARIDAAAGTFTNLSQATAGARPVLQLNATTGYYFLDFDATDDALASAAQVAGSVDAVTVCAAVVTKNGSANSARILGYGGPTQSGANGLACVGSATWTPYFYSRGTTGATATGSDTLPGPDALVLVGQGDISTDTCTLDVNGTQVATAANDQGTGNWVSRSVLVGYTGAGNGLNACWYGGLHIRRALTAQEISDMEVMLAARCGAVLA